MSNDQRQPAPSYSYSLEMIFPGASFTAIASAAALATFGGGALAAMAALPNPTAATAATTSNFLISLIPYWLQGSAKYEIGSLGACLPSLYNFPILARFRSPWPSCG